LMVVKIKLECLYFNVGQKLWLVSLFPDKEIGIEYFQKDKSV